MTAALSAIQRELDHVNAYFKSLEPQNTGQQNTEQDEIMILEFLLGYEDERRKEAVYAKYVAGDFEACVLAMKEEKLDPEKGGIKISSRKTLVDKLFHLKLKHLKGQR